jgi:hypothetical protein
MVAVCFVTDLTYPSLIGSSRTEMKPGRSTRANYSSCQAFTQRVSILIMDLVKASPTFGLCTGCPRSRRCGTPTSGSSATRRSTTRPATTPPTAATPPPGEGPAMAAGPGTSAESRRELMLLTLVDHLKWRVPTLVVVGRRSPRQEARVLERRGWDADPAMGKCSTCRASKRPTRCEISGYFT